MAVIEVDNLVRTYRSRKGLIRRRTTTVEAVRGISFAIERGELFGLLGPNGAGKTTTIKILTTLLLPTSGSARVLGFDPARQPREVRKRIGYVFGGERGLYDRLSGLDNLRYFADLYRVPVADKRRRIEELLELVGLAGRERERVETYSRGMRQRLHIARGLLHDPEVLFLDEPTIGLDPIGARELRDTIAALSTEGKTILLTTHYMFEADALCDRLAVIADGKFVATGTPVDLKGAVADRTIIELETFGATETAIDGVRSLRGVAGVAVETREQTQVVLVQSAVGGELTAPVPLAVTIAPITIASGVVGAYSLLATLAWGTLLFDVPLAIEHPVAFAFAVPACILAVGMMGLITAATFVLYRAAFSLGVSLQYPVWIVTGVLVPLAVLPDFVGPISWFLAPTWGFQAIREAALGGTPWEDIGMCVVLSTGYLAVAASCLQFFERVARARATLRLS